MLDFSNTTKIQINQLYHPTGEFKIQSQAIIYSRGNLNLTKFVPILLKEWFYLIKVNGFLAIDYIPNKFCTEQKLEEYMTFLWPGKYEITYHGFINDNEIENVDEEKIKKFLNQKKKNGEKRKWVRFICRKKTSLKIEGDEITKWTFGLITNGKRVEWVDQIIDSIRKQKIPNYEIIICGTHEDKAEKDIIYIPFNKKDNKGWITKKKNLIVKKAKYENICMLHDRIILNKDWFEGMMKWGNCFEDLGCRQLFNGQRVNDWLASHYYINSKEGEKFSFESLVDYRDWYPDIWFLGQMNIFKKSIITKNNLWWNEDLYYGDREDFDFSIKLHMRGFIHRFNDLSSVSTFTNKYNNPTFIKYDPYTVNPIMRFNNSNSFLKYVTFIFLRTLHLLGINLSLHMLEKWRGKIYTWILMFNLRKNQSI